MYTTALIFFLLLHAHKSHLYLHSMLPIAQNILALNHNIKNRDQKTEPELNVGKKMRQKDKQ